MRSSLVICKFAYLPTLPSRFFEAELELMKKIQPEVVFDLKGFLAEE